MKAINEIGFAKSFRFVFFTFYCLFIDLVLFHPLKILLLRIAGAKIGRNVIIHRIRFFNLYHRGFSNLEVGDYCFLGDEVMLDLADKVVLKDHVTLSNRVLVLTHTNVGFENHPLQRHYPRVTKAVKIEEGSFIGAGAILLPGVTVSGESMVGAGAVVNRNVAKNTVVAGVPAKIIKKLKKK